MIVLTLTFSPAEHEARTDASREGFGSVEDHARTVGHDDWKSYVNSSL